MITCSDRSGTSNVPIFAILLCSSFGIFIVSSNTISTTTEMTSQEGGVESICSNEFPDDFCEVLMQSESCEHEDPDSPLQTKCRRACGLCMNNEDSEINDGLESGKCEDKLPDCSQYLSVCCSMKDAMNVSCPKTCKFCTDTPATAMPPGAPGGVDGVGGQTTPVPSGSSNQDPCNPTNPPSATVDAPGQSTTTTMSPVSGPTASLPPVG